MTVRPCDSSRLNTVCSTLFVKSGFDSISFLKIFCFMIVL